MPSTFQPELDLKRITNLQKAVHILMLDGRWRTFSDIKTALGMGGEASISARLRDLRKPPFGYRVDRRRRGEPSHGLFEYRVVLPSII